MANKVIQLKDGSDNLFPTPPNDYIVEQGTSGIWTYRKWNSGIAECWGIKDSQVTQWDTWGNLFEGAPAVQENFPSGLFISAPLFYVTATAWAGLAGVETWKEPTATQTPILNVIRPSTVGAGTVHFNMYAKGKWK